MKHGVKVTLLSLGASVLIVAVVFLLVWQFGQPLFSPPDQPREWARQLYDETFLSSSSAGSLPTLSSTAPLSVELARQPGKVTVETEGPKIDSIRTFYEVFTADAGGEVVLPAGNRLRLDAVGIVMPEDTADKEEPSGSMSDVVWLDPETLAPLPAEKTADWDSRRWVSGETPVFFFRISNEGGAAVRWLGPEVFDDRTLMQAQGGSSYLSHEKDGQFSVDLDLWHQTPLRIAVNFSFGEPELRDLELTPGAEVRFGGDALVRVVEVTSKSFNSISHRSDFQDNREKIWSSFSYPTTPTSGSYRGRGVIFHVWPAHNERLIDFAIEETKPPGEKRYLNAWGSDGITHAEIRKESDLESVQARRMPRLGRAVFLLPRIPRLPDSNNLFNTPITRVELRYRSHMENLIRKGAAVQWSGGSGRAISDTHFPMILENTTPAKVLRFNEELAGRPLFFDKKELKISDTRSGKLTDLKEWWRRTKPGWWR